MFQCMRLWVLGLKVGLKVWGVRDQALGLYFRVWCFLGLEGDGLGLQAQDVVLKLLCSAMLVMASGRACQSLGDSILYEGHTHTHKHKKLYAYLHICIHIHIV